MRTLLLISLLCLPATASAQNYQSALRVTPGERNEIENRLSNILDFARPNEVNRFRLPSGRTVKVRSYQPTRGDGGQPCRGYRIDLEGGGRFMAVDGFRCRQANNRWRIVEPEIVLAESGQAPLVLDPNAQDGGTSAERTSDGLSAPYRRRTDEPLYADDTRAGGQELNDDVPTTITYNADGVPAGFEHQVAANVPIPRPAPRDEFRARRADADPTNTAAAAPVSNEMQERVERARRLEETVAAVVRPDQEPDATRDATASIGTNVPAAVTDADVASAIVDEVRTAARGPAPRAQPDPAATETGNESDTQSTVAGIAPQEQADETATQQSVRVEPPADAPARLVGVKSPREGDGYASDDRIVEALRLLSYLEAEDPSPRAVNAAVDEFALDERFALPVTNATLMARLDDAIDRSMAISDCDETIESAGICLDQ